MYADDAYRRLARHPSLHTTAAEPLPAINEMITAERLQAARAMADLGYTEAAERIQPWARTVEQMTGS
ncbi:hypothetical protein ACIRBY_32105 [Streptomyces sp. NPDC096136]|uniref:hypothetical protein n=1 Tax=Streptomyces sp. NPDC096136 TaxID=3366076 RepID=UPI00381E8A92